MLGRHRDRFLAQIDRRRLEDAIRSAESETAAPIRVAVLPRVRGSLAKVSELTAHRLGMTTLPGRNGVVIVVVPSRREFHVWGDRAIHEKVGEPFWKEVAEKISAKFRKGDFTGGLEAGIQEAARELAANFPKPPAPPPTRP